MARLRFGRPISLRWNGLLLEGPANTVFEIPDEFYEEFNQDIGTVEPTIVWLDADEGATLRGRVTALEGAGSATLSSDAALALGTASAGVGTEASRDDHVHPTTGLALSGHNHDASYSSTAHNHSGVYELSGAVSTHESAGDPHPGYLTETAASSTYATSGHNHNGTYEPVNTAILKTIVDAKGDLIVGTAADTVNRLPGSGTNGHVLTYDSAETTGLKWAAAPGAGGGTSVGTATPLALGTASAGDDTTASREDHVHPTTGLALSGHTHAVGPASYTSVLLEVVKNDATAKTKGEVVYISSVNGNNPIISYADADTEATSSKTLGLLLSNASTNQTDVQVITNGLIEDIDTSTVSAAQLAVSPSYTVADGDSVFLSTTAGQKWYGGPPPEPAHAVYLGIVTKANSSTGKMLVKVQNGYELDELHDVSAASPSPGDILQYNSTSGMWEKESLSTAGIAASGHNHDGSYSTTAHNHNGTYEVSGAVSTHNSSVTHLALGTSSVTAAAGDHAHTGVYEVSGTTATHAGLTTSVHGISNTANLVYTSDSRLSDARTPTSHTHVQADSHNSPDTDTATTSLHHTLGTGSNQAAAGNHSHTGFLATTGGTLTGDLTLNVASGHLTLNSQTDLRLADSDSSNWVALQAPATVASNVTWTLPAADGTAGQVLSTSGAGALSWATASGGGGGSSSVTVESKSASFTIAAGDSGKLYLCGTANLTITLPQDSAATYATGSMIHVVRNGTFTVTFAAGTGATVNRTYGLTLRAQYSAATLIKTAANTWTIVGDVA